MPDAIAAAERARLRLADAVLVADRLLAELRAEVERPAALEAVTPPAG